MKNKVSRFIKRILIIIRKPEMAILPGQLAFFFVLSLVPAISLIGIIASMFSISIDKVSAFLNISFSTDINNAISELLTGKSFDSNMGVFLFATFLIATNGMVSIVRTSNILYNTKSDDYIRLRIKAILLTLIIVSLMIFILLVPAFGGFILKLVKNNGISNMISDEIYTVYSLLKWPLSFLFIYFNIKLIYTVAPDIKIKSKDVTYGALFTSIMWIIATSIFSYYVTNLARYDIFYGSLSNIIVLMFWIYILCYVFVLGMALNASKTELDRTLTNIF